MEFVREGQRTRRSHSVIEASFSKSKQERTIEKFAGKQELDRDRESKSEFRKEPRKGRVQEREREQERWKIT